MDKVKFCASLQALMTIDFSDVLFIFILHDWEAENCICCFNCFSVHSYNLLRFLSLCLGAYLGNLSGDQISAYLIVFCLHTQFRQILITFFWLLLATCHQFVNLFHPILRHFFPQPLPSKRKFVHGGSVLFQLFSCNVSKILEIILIRVLIKDFPFGTYNCYLNNGA